MCNLNSSAATKLLVMTPGLGISFVLQASCSVYGLIGVKAEVEGIADGWSKIKDDLEVERSDWDASTGSETTW